MIIKGYKKTLVEEEIYDLEKENTTGHLLENFDKKWIPSVQKVKQKSLTNKGKTKPTINVVGPILKTFGKELAFLCCVSFLVSFMPFISSIVLDWLISFINNDEPTWRGYFYASLMFISPLIESVINNYFLIAINVISMRMKSCLISIIYKKVCKK